MTDSAPPATFARMESRSLADLQHTGVAIIGIAEASPYKPGEASHSARAPGALRAASKAIMGQLQQFDFDLGGTLLRSPDDTRGIVDLGDLPTNPADVAGNCALITAAIRAIRDAGAVPVVLGSDDSLPIPVLRANEGSSPLTIVQVDGHVDWGDVIQGNPNGYGSTMRRAAETSWVRCMVQVGMGGLGSGTADQMDDARRWGSRVFTAREFCRSGIREAIEAVPYAAERIVTIDRDGLDPALMPAVGGMPTPGGIDYLTCSTCSTASRIGAGSSASSSPSSSPKGSARPRHHGRRPYRADGNRPDPGHGPHRGDGPDRGDVNLVQADAAVASSRLLRNAVTAASSAVSPDPESSNVCSARARKPSSRLPSR